MLREDPNQHTNGRLLELPPPSVTIKKVEATVARGLLTYACLLEVKGEERPESAMFRIDEIAAFRVGQIPGFPAVTTTIMLAGGTNVPLVGDHAELLAQHLGA